MEQPPQESPQEQPQQPWGRLLRLGGEESEPPVLLRKREWTIGRRRGARRGGDGGWRGRGGAGTGTGVGDREPGRGGAGGLAAGMGTGVADLEPGTGWGRGREMGSGCGRRPWAGSRARWARRL